MVGLNTNISVIVNGLTTLIKSQIGKKLKPNYVLLV